MDNHTQKSSYTWKENMHLVNFVLSLYVIFWLFNNVYRSFDEKPKKVKKGRSPRLAVAIPAHNEGPGIGATVKSILTAGAKAGITARDIFILCNGCKDDTAEQVEKCGVTPVIA